MKSFTRVFKIEPEIKIQRQRAHRVVATMKNFGDIINFVFAKQLLEPMQLFITCLQGKIAELYFGFKEVEKIIYICEETRVKAISDISLAISNQCTPKLLVWLTTRGPC